jgi:hypothetical protein
VILTIGASLLRKGIAVGKGTEPDYRPDCRGSDGSVPTLLLSEKKGRRDARGTNWSVICC